VNEPAVKLAAAGSLERISALRTAPGGSKPGENDPRKKAGPAPASGTGPALEGQALDREVLYRRRRIRARPPRPSRASVAGSGTFVSMVSFIVPVTVLVLVTLKLFVG